MGASEELWGAKLPDPDIGLASLGTILSGHQLQSDTGLVQPAL